MRPRSIWATTSLMWRMGRVTLLRRQRQHASGGGQHHHDEFGAAFAQPVQAHLDDGVAAQGDTIGGGCLLEQVVAAGQCRRPYGHDGGDVGVEQHPLLAVEHG